MNMKKPSPKKEKKPPTMIRHRDRDIILDTFVIDEKPWYYIYHRKDGTMQYEDESYSLHWVEYVPLEPQSTYIKNQCLIFPSDLAPYENIEALLGEISQYVYRYCDVTPVFGRIVPYFVLLTYLYEDFYEIPYLRVIWDYGSGKSRFLRVVWNICYNPIIANGGTSLSSLFRMIEISKWTLVLDEADFQFSDTTNEIIKLLNNGFAKGNPILRADGDNFEPRAYDVYCPKIIGGRFEFRDKATESRCINEVMKRTQRTDIPLNLTETFDRESESLRNKLYQFRYDYQWKIAIQEERIAWLEWRLNQILNPILSIIKSIWKKEDYENIIAYFQWRQKEIREERKFSIEGMIFAIIQEKESKNFPNVYYSHILADLKEMDASSQMNPRKLWSLLKQHEIKTLRRNDGFVIPIRENRLELDRIYKQYDLQSSLKTEEVDLVFS